ncbi:MAG: single-stranded-DNA-specific exonuclease RecJ [Patescibacteria group bacterium]
MSVSSYPEIFELLLKERGIGSKDRDSFLKPDYNLLHDPLLLPDIERARDRVLEAIARGEHIVVFSDYDADGIPGAVVLSDFFKRIGYQNHSFYIPHRHDEGYGMNLEAVKECAERGAKLIITIDCGISDVEEIALANSLGINVIVTDHHEPHAELPAAFAIVNPKLKDSKYPFDGLCGSAVAYKLVQAIYAKNNFGQKVGIEKWSLDMVGIATLSDMVPLVGENRILAHFGLEVLRRSPRPGLAALFNKLNLDRRTMSEDDITFSITPRINAASRMGIPEDAFKLLSTDDPVEAMRLAEHLEKINAERKGLVASMVKEAKAHLKKRESIPAVIVIGNPEWKPSLAGLICNSLVEEYERPVFAWGRDGDGTLKGSCRSYNGYDLHALMTGTRNSFIEFGGHKGAGGFSVTLEQVSVLEEKLSEALAKLSSEEEILESGLVISLSDIGEGLWRTVSQFAPFGMGNEKPVFKIVNAPIQSVKQFGKTKEHLELTLSSSLKAISFFSSPTSYSLLPTATSCTLHAHLEKSYFRNRPELRLRIVNIEI